MRKKINNKERLSASKMRVVLSVLLVLILTGMAGGFYMAYSSLSVTAEEVAKIQSEADSSDAKLQQLMSLHSQLEAHGKMVDKAKQIVAESRSYQYQNQIISDLTLYAKKAGVTVTSFNFQDNSASLSSSSNSTAEPESDAQEMPGLSQTSPAAQSPSPRSMSVSVQLGQNLKYKELLHFVYLIEQNLTRMQVSELMMTKGEDKDGVGTQALSLEVYIR